MRRTTSFARLAFLAAFSVGADEYLDCSTVFRLLFPAESAEWLRVSVRDLKDPILDGDYLKRLHDSTATVFVPWLENPNGQSFRDMLREQHRHATTDLQGNAYYHGVSVTGLRPSIIVSPGLFLYEFKEIQTPIRWGSLWRDPAKYMTSQSGALEAVQASTAKHRAKAKGEEAPIIYSFALPRLPGVSVENHLNVKDGTILHRYVRYDQVPDVLEALDTLFSEIRPAVKAKKEEAVIDLLSEYVYMASNSHFFRGANFSIIMAHVNWTLKQSGLRGISHGDLDYATFYLDFESFQKIFRDQIRKENPQS
jgi:hypothetical protein